MSNVIENINCIIYIDDWSWILKDPSTATHQMKIILDKDTGLDDDEYLVLDSLYLYCERMVNTDSKSFKTSSGTTVAKGQLKSNANMKIEYVEAGGIKSEQRGVAIEPSKVQIQPQDYKYPPIPSTASYANTSKAYKFTFPKKPIVINKSITLTVKVSGMGNNNTNGLTFRHKYDTPGNLKNRIAGKALVKKMTSYPDSIDTDVSNVWITNKTGKTKNGSTILADGTNTLNLVVKGDGDEIADVKFSGNTNESCSLNKNNRIITVKAKNTTANYSTSDKVTISIKGDTKRLEADFYVNFYKKPSVTITTKNLKVNIKDANKYVQLNKYDVDGLTKPKNGTYSAIKYTVNGATSSWSTSKTPVPDSNRRVYMGKYLGIASDNDNYFKIKNENVLHTIYFKYFNPNVQTVGVDGNYDSIVKFNYTFYAKPREKAQFSYNWLNSSGTQTTTEQSVILPGIAGAYVPANLKYTNASITGGYCRTIEFKYYDSKGTLLYSEVKETSDQSDGSSLLSGRIILKNSVAWNTLRSKLGNKYLTEKLTIKAKLAFFFNDNHSKLYCGCTHEWKNKLWLITEEDLKVERLFPIVNEAAPATPMMLTDVERFGYILSSAITDNVNALGVRFGVRVDSKVTFTDNNNYFSSNNIKQHIIFDAGKYVADNNINLAQCTIKPLLTINPGGNGQVPLEIVQSTSNWKSPNAVVNTLDSTMWYRPVAKSGEYTTYFDIDRFQQFIDKYTPLNNNKPFSPIVREKRGDIITIRFWKDIEEKLIAYSNAMQNWVAGSVTNYAVVWAFPEFKHKQGEYITNNNLYQNYWDLLHMFSGYDSFATHNYLKDSNYSHNSLGTHSYDDITNKRGI